MGALRQIPKAGVGCSSCTSPDVYIVVIVVTYLQSQNRRSKRGVQKKRVLGALLGWAPLWAPCPDILLTRQSPVDRSSCMDSCSL